MVVVDAVEAELNVRLNLLIALDESLHAKLLDVSV